MRYLYLALAGALAGAILIEVGGEVMARRYYHASRWGKGEPWGRK